VTELAIELPLPPKELSPNARTYFIKKNKFTQQYRCIAKVAANYAKGRGFKAWRKAETEIQWFTKTKKQPDPDNALATLKAGFDGIADAGIVTNDRGLSHRPIVFFVDKENPRVCITIRELGGT